MNNRLIYIFKDYIIRKIIEIKEDEDDIHYYLELDCIIINVILYNSNEIEEYFIV